MEKVEKIILLFAIGAIKGYQVLSGSWPPQCRFFPSCSAYTLTAIEQFGVLHGCFLGAKRICSCHPFSKRYGVDLVPDPDRDK